MKNITKVIADYTRQFRKKKGLTQEDIAEQCNLHPTYIAKIESGRQTCSLKTLARISKALNIPTQALLGPVTKKQMYKLQNKYLLELLDKGSKKDKEIIFAIAKTLLKRKKKKK